MSNDSTSTHTVCNRATDAQMAHLGMWVQEQQQHRQQQPDRGRLDSRVDLAGGGRHTTAGPGRGPLAGRAPSRARRRAAPSAVTPQRAAGRVPPGQPGPLGNAGGPRQPWTSGATAFPSTASPRAGWPSATPGARRSTTCSAPFCVLCLMRKPGCANKRDSLQTSPQTV